MITGLPTHDEKITTRFHMVLCSILALVTTACSPSFKVSTEAPVTVREGSLRSFKFYNPRNVPASNFSFSEENQKVLFDAIAGTMAEKGYTSRQDADVVIKVQGGTRLVHERRDNRTGFNDPFLRGYPYGGRYYYGSPYYPAYDRQFQDISSKETTIIIDVLDAKNESLIWQGSGTGVIGKRETEVPEKLAEAVRNIMQKYPYSAHGTR